MSGAGGAMAATERLWPHDPETDDQLVQALFGIHPASSAAVVPAADHPFVPLSRGETWYPATAVAGRAYVDRFLPSAELRTVRGFPNLRHEDSVIAFGSQSSNIVARGILGNPWESEPIVHVATSGWRADLHWNIHTPASANVMEYVQFGSVWRVSNHQVVAASGDVFAPRAGIEWIADDYLLITSLPRYKDGPQRVLVFGGAHGLATQASTLLLSQPPLDELRRLHRLIRGEPWYQALFRVVVSHPSASLFQPVSLHLVDARPLMVEFAQT